MITELEVKNKKDNRSFRGFLWCSGFLNAIQLKKIPKLRNENVKQIHPFALLEESMFKTELESVQGHFVNAKVSVIEKKTEKHTS